MQNLNLCFEKVEVRDSLLVISLKSDLMKKVDRWMGLIEQITMLAAST